MVMIESNLSRKIDIMPFNEAQREVCETKVNLHPRQYIKVGDDENNVFVRRSYGEKVYGREVYKGHTIIDGLMRLSGEEKCYQVAIGEAGVVKIIGGEMDGDVREFTILKPVAVKFDTNGEIIEDKEDQFIQPAQD